MARRIIVIAESEEARREREIRELDQQWEQPAFGTVTGYHDLLDDFTKSYVQAALWSSDDDDGPLDERFGPEHIDPVTMQGMLEDCARFQRENADDIDGRDGRAGHDFWLTRNHHGAGFWDGDWPEPAASRLTSAAHDFGEARVEIGDEHYDDDDYDDDDDYNDDDDDPSRSPDMTKQLQFAHLLQNRKSIRCASSMTAYHGTVWNLLTGDRFETLDPLAACRALEFSEDIETARGRCLDAMDFDQGEVEVIFRAKIDLDRVERHGDEIWVLDPSAVSEQQSRAVMGDDQWTEWMDPGDLWLHLLDINGLLPVLSVSFALLAGYDRLGG